MSRQIYPCNVSDEEWAFVVPYLTLMKEDAPQREHDLRKVFKASRWMVKSGSPWRYLPHNFPRWEVVYQQTQRGMRSTPENGQRAVYNGHKKTKGSKVHHILGMAREYFFTCTGWILLSHRVYKTC